MSQLAIITNAYALLLLANPPSSEAPERVWVLATESQGLPDGWSQAFQAQLGQATDACEGVEALNPGEFDELLAFERSRRQLGCESDTECLARIREAAGAEQVLSSSVGKIGSQYVVSLIRVDTRQGKVLARVNETKSSLDRVLEDLPSLVARVFDSGGRTSPRFALPGDEPISIAVFDLRAAGVRDDLATNLTQVLSAALAALSGTTVITGDDVDSMLQLEAAKSRLGCWDDMSCMAEIGGALGVDKLVTGQVGRVVERYVVSLRLIDTREARVDNRVTHIFRSAEDQLIAALRHCARNLLGVEATQPGTLAVASPEANVHIRLNETPHGTLPRPPLPALNPGMHTLWLTKRGFYEWRSDVFIEPASTTAVWAELEAKPARWPFYGSATVAATAALAATTLGVLAKHYEREARGLYATNTRPAARSRHQANAEWLAERANTAWLATAGLTMLTGAIAYFTDWSD